MGSLGRVLAYSFQSSASAIHWLARAEAALDASASLRSFLSCTTPASMARASSRYVLTSIGRPRKVPRWTGVEMPAAPGCAPPGSGACGLALCCSVRDTAALLAPGVAAGPGPVEGRAAPGPGPGPTAGRAGRFWSTAQGSKQRARTTTTAHAASPASTMKSYQAPCTVGGLVSRGRSVCWDDAAGCPELLARSATASASRSRGSAVLLIGVFTRESAAPVCCTV